MLELLQRLDTWLALFTLAAVAWYLGIRPLLDHLEFDMGKALRRLLGRRPVNTYTDADPGDYVASRPVAVADSRRDPGLSAGLSVPSAPAAAAPPAVRNIMVNRSRAGLIAALVAAGWKTGEIRAMLKGDNGAIGKEVEAERVRQGLAPEAVRRSPIAGRELPPDAQFIDDDTLVEARGSR